MADDPHRIALDDAIDLVRRAQAGPLLPVDSWCFGAGIVREILDQPGVAQLRICMARKPTGEPTLVLVGVDAEGRDLAKGTLAEEGMPCPPFCDSSSPLGRAG